jgi:hypothetical protein
MPLGSRKKNSGKGDSHSFQHRVLLLLNQIVQASGGSTSDCSCFTPLNENLIKIDNTLSKKVRSAGFKRYNGAGSITGAREISFFNAGTTDAILMGDKLKPGEMVTFEANGVRDELDQISFDATGTDLVVSWVI